MNICIRSCGGCTSTPGTYGLGCRARQCFRTGQTCPQQELETIAEVHNIQYIGFIHSEANKWGLSSVLVGVWTGLCVRQIVRDRRLSIRTTRYMPSIVVEGTSANRQADKKGSGGTQARSMYPQSMSKFVLVFLGFRLGCPLSKPSRLSSPSPTTFTFPPIPGN